MHFFYKRIWSLKTNSTISKRSMEHGIRSCSFNCDGSSLAVGMLNGSFAVLKTRSGHARVSVTDYV